MPLGDFRFESEELAELGEGAGVDDIPSPKPALAGDGGAEVRKTEVFGLVRVRIQTAENAQMTGAVPPAPVKIEAPRVLIGRLSFFNSNKAIKC